MIPTVADVLAMPVVRAGEPQVIGGGEALDRSVRWVHVSEVSDVASLLAGGELVLTVGQPLSFGDAAAVDYLTSLAGAGVTGVIVELGEFVSAATLTSPVIATTADALGLPVVALHQITRFVEITEAVHRLIVADQYAELEFARSVHETFTALSVQRAAPAVVVDTVAEMLDSSVVLEDLAHRLLTSAARHESTALLLHDWESRSRMATADWTAVAVGPDSQTWGRLIAPATPSTEAGSSARTQMILERAAQTLTLHRMIDKDQFGLQRQAQTGLIDDLINGRLEEAEALARAAALGLSRRSRYVALALDWAADVETDPVARQRRSAAVVDATMHGLGLANATALIAAGDQLSFIVALPRGASLDDSLGRVCTTIAGEVHRVDGVERVVIGVGADTDALLEAAHELRHAVHIAEVAMAMNPRNPGSRTSLRPFYRSEDVRLRGLLAMIGGEPGVQRFAETELGALLRHDLRHHGELTDTLRQFLDLAGNKTELARRLAISRPTLYDRLARIERILNVDLDNGESRTCLHTALLIRNSAV